MRACVLVEARGNLRRLSSDCQSWLIIVIVVVVETGSSTASTAGLKLADSGRAGWIPARP